MPIEVSISSQPITAADDRPGFAALVTDDCGQDLIEYALLAALLGLTATTAVKGLGTKIATAFTNVNSTLTSNV